MFVPEPPASSADAPNRRSFLSCCAGLAAGSAAPEIPPRRRRLRPRAARFHFADHLGRRFDVEVAVGSSSYAESLRDDGWSTIAIGKVGIACMVTVDDPPVIDRERRRRLRRAVLGMAGMDASEDPTDDELERAIAIVQARP